MRGAICSPFVSLKTIVCLQLVFLKTSLEALSNIESASRDVFRKTNCKQTIVFNETNGEQMAPRMIPRADGGLSGEQEINRSAAGSSKGSRARNRSGCLGG